MKEKIFSQKIENFFPGGLVFGGIIMIILGTGVLIFESIFGIILLIAGILIVFLHYGLLIDFEKNNYKEYWVF